jgi:hypothetical protein
MPGRPFQKAGSGAGNRHQPKNVHTLTRTVMPDIGGSLTLSAQRSAGFGSCVLSWRRDVNPRVPDTMQTAAAGRDTQLKQNLFYYEKNNHVEHRGGGAGRLVRECG